MEAQESSKLRNKMVAQQQKEDTRAALDCVELEKQEDLKRAQQLAKDVQAERINPRLEEEKILRAKEVHAESLRKQKEVDFERVRKEQEYEMAKKKDLIRQIRALERVSIVRPVPFDPSEPPRHGVVEVKRHNIIDDRNQRVEDLAGRAEQCAKTREMAREESEIRREKILARKAEEEKG